MTVVKRLDRLTPEQEAMLPGIRDEWLACGLSTEPADRAAAEDGVRLAYRAAGLEPPRIMIWLDSPMAGALGQAYAAALLKNSDQVSDQVSGQVLGQVLGQVSGQVSDQVRGQVWDQVSGQVSDQVRGQVSDQVRDQVSVQVWDQVWDQVSDQVSDQVWGQVSGQVWGQVSGQVSDQVSDQVRNWSRACIWGQHDGGWLAFYAAMQEFGIDAPKAMAGLRQVARNSGWWWAFRGFVILTDRPAELHRDKDTRLHCEAGPAIRYRDGFSLYLWHGTRVPADLIETGWDTERIFREPNAEVRRCAIERLGWAEFIESSGMKQIGERVSDPGNAPHTLTLYDLPEKLSDMYEERARILLCTNGSDERDGSRHQFGLVVPGHHTDPIDAAASLYDIPPAAYRQLQVRR